jgi:transcriptional regulator with XRE-family HTH domain
MTRREDERFALDFTTEFVVRDGYSVYLASPITQLGPAAKDELLVIGRIAKEILERTGASVYNPAEITGLGSSHSAEDVYTLDHNHCASSDIVFFVVPEPSLGVGIEAQITASCTVPRVVAWPAQTRMSRMMLGIFAPTAAEIPYADVDDFRLKLEGLAENIRKVALQSRTNRSAVDVLLRRSNLGMRIVMRRFELGLTRAKLAEDTGIREFWLREVEKSEACIASMSLTMLIRMAIRLAFRIDFGDNLQLVLKDEGDTKTSEVRDSLVNLAAFATQTSPDPDEDKVLQLWADYMGERTEAIRRRTSGRSRGNGKKVVTIADWAERYHLLAG